MSTWLIIGGGLLGTWLLLRSNASSSGGSVLVSGAGNAATPAPAAASALPSATPTASPTPTPGTFLHVPDWATNAELVSAGVTQYQQVGSGGFVPISTTEQYGGQTVAPVDAQGNTYYLSPGSIAPPVPGPSGIIQGTVQH